MAGWEERDVPCARRRSVVVPNSADAEPMGSSGRTDFCWRRMEASRIGMGKGQCRMAEP